MRTEANLKHEHSISERILSVDLLRGLTVAGMILVNNPGSWSHMYPPLKHAKWDGCTPTDLVFPFFLLAVGAAIPFSVKNGLSEFPKILKRSVLLVLLGLFLNFFGEWSIGELRIPGVLQRIGFTYFFGALVFSRENRIFRGALFLSLIVGYWWLLGFVPPPGTELPNMTEGKDWGAWLDRFVFGEKHLWRFGKVWDPEGLLTSVSAIGSVFLGTFFGEILQTRMEKGESRIKIGFVFALAAGILFLVGGIWNLSFPVNKSLWTSSYTLWTGGYAAAVLSLFLILETKPNSVLESVKRAFLPFGRNALLVFFASGIYARSLNIIQISTREGKKTSLKNHIYLQYYKSWIDSPELASFCYSVTVLLVWYLILFVLDKKRIYWRI